MSANERTFQGELYRVINYILTTNQKIEFSKITQEENVGTKGKARFADGKLYSRTNQSKIVSFELKNSSWDATDDILVSDAAIKAMNNGYEYFVTGTPRQLVIYKTFTAGVPLNERKLKIFNISNVRKDDEILSSFYEKEITPKLTDFLKELSDIVHEVKKVNWDSIDKFFVHKLSAYILEASASMFPLMYERIEKSKNYKQRLKEYLKNQDIFNVTLNFNVHDVYKICQLSNYLLFLKIIFYSYLQREVKELNLKPLDIPADKTLLNKTLRSRFNDVLKHDFEMIFSENVFDEFEFEDRYIPLLQSNVEQIKNLKFDDLSADIIGAIYNTLIENQEQHDRGQHFTNTNEVDIVNGFCIKKDTKNVLDSGCGAGTFLVRAYFFMKQFNPNLSHQELLEHIWGIEIAPFPVFLSTMNLSLLNIKTIDNYPVIINSDFAKIKSGSSYSGIFLNVSKTFEVKQLNEKRKEVKLPLFDACVGNPPYIRQELIQDKENWNKLAKDEHGVKKINQQSDLYVYYLMHTAAFLKEGGRLGYVISSSWLDVSFGGGLQQFLLDNFKIIAIIDQQKNRSFETALINTVILILEKCSDNKIRSTNDVKFVRMFVEYENLIGNSTDKDRFSKISDFINHIENIKSDWIDDKLKIQIINQENLKNQSYLDGRYQNGHWGAKYLRSPNIYNKIIEHSNQKFVPVSSMMKVKYGIKTGANDFFYLKDETQKALEMSERDYELMFGMEKSKHSIIWKQCSWCLSNLNSQHYIIEKEYMSQVFKSQSEARYLDVDKSNLKYSVLTCNVPKTTLAKLKKNVLKYINDAEEHEQEPHKRPSVIYREPSWYDLTSETFVGDFIFPSKIGEFFRLIDNREAQVYCDKVNYVISIKDNYIEYSNEIFLILNSITFRYLIDLFARQMVVKVSDVDVNLVQKTPIISPELFRQYAGDIKPLLESLKSREQTSIYEEVLKEDKFKIDSIIFRAIGLTDNDVREMYSEAVKYVKDRQEKSDSLTTTKSKQKLSFEDSLRLVEDRYPEVNKYKNLIKNKSSRIITIPKGKTSKTKLNTDVNNMFGDYNVIFSDGKSLTSISFVNLDQMLLFKFLVDTLEVKEKIKLPNSAEDCSKILQVIKNDFETHINQIKSMLKSNRSTANYMSIYRDLLFL